MDGAAIHQDASLAEVAARPVHHALERPGGEAPGALGNASGLPLLERAVVLSAGGIPLERAKAEFALAKVLGEPRRARELAEDAQGIFARLHRDALAHEVEAWLAQGRKVSPSMLEGLRILSPGPTGSPRVPRR